MFPAGGAGFWSEPRSSAGAGGGCECDTSAEAPAPLQEELLAKQAKWCREYAKVNAAGLRKIAKKHDKRVSGDAGQRFVQVRSAHLCSVLKGLGLML